MVSTMTAPQRPTKIRYLILALTVCVAVLLYLDRYCLGFVLPYVRENYQLSERDARFLVSAFFYTYAFGQIPCGWLSDRFGTRLMLSLYLAIWSTLTGLMGFAQGFLTLVMFRFGCGLFEAAPIPRARADSPLDSVSSARLRQRRGVDRWPTGRYHRPTSDRLPHGPLFAYFDAIIDRRARPVQPAQARS